MLIDAMANSTRLMVLSRLVKGEMSVGALGKLVGISQSALSQHLAKLRGAGLVITRRDAQMVYYSCTSLAVIRILEQLAEYFPDGL
jgi:DNA-binding transcriptional ArsR family regulator